MRVHREMRQQHACTIRLVGFDLHEEERRAAGVLQQLDLAAREVLRLGPLGDKLERLLLKAVRGPFGVKRRAHVRNADEVAERRRAAEGDDRRARGHGRGPGRRDPLPGGRGLRPHRPRLRGRRRPRGGRRDLGRRHRNIRCGRVYASHARLEATRASALQP